MIDLFNKKRSEEFTEQLNEWINKNAHRLSQEHKKLNLKAGDIIVFKNGYDIPMATKILGFDIETNQAYLFWDCFWTSIDLEKRLFKSKRKIVITPKILRLNEKANAVSSLKDEILNYIETLNNNKNVVVGYRAACGTMDKTMKVFKLWKQVLKEIQKQDIFLIERHLTMDNSWATLKGGFWKETMYIM